MIFEKALEAMRTGKKVRRTPWGADEWLNIQYPGINDLWQPFIVRIYPTGRYHDFEVDSYDLLAEDWEIID